MELVLMDGFSQKMLAVACQHNAARTPLLQRLNQLVLIGWGILVHSWRGGGPLPKPRDSAGEMSEYVIYTAAK